MEMESRKVREYVHSRTGEIIVGFRMLHPDVRKEDDVFEAKDGWKRCPEDLVGKILIIDQKLWVRPVKKQESTE